MLPLRGPLSAQGSAGVRLAFHRVSLPNCKPLWPLGVSGDESRQAARAADDVPAVPDKYPLRGPATQVQSCCRIPDVL